MADHFIAYTDETGNTGNNIFDKAQPYFWTATLLSEIDIEDIGKPYIEKWKTELDVLELHANQLGYKGIEIIAKEFKDFICKNNIRFIFTTLEKRHLASMKLVDSILDSGLNMAVSNFHYGIRGLRITLAYILCKNISPKAQEKFWSVFDTVDLTEYVKILESLKWNIENKVNDLRAKKLLLDAISWAIIHPENLLHKKSLLDSPNAVTFSLLVHSLHNILKPTGKKVKKFIHDKQNQFAETLKFIYSNLKNLSVPMETLSWMGEIEEVKTYLGDIEFIESNLAVGLQITDIVLWLIKRYKTDKELLAYYKECSSLAEYILLNGIVSDFSFKQLEESNLQVFMDIYQLPLSPKEIDKGINTIMEIEEKRIKRLSSSVE